MRQLFAGILAILPTVANAEPVTLTCFYVASGDGQPVHQTLVLDEAKGTALWTDLDKANSEPKLLKATSEPDTVDVAVFPKPADAHFRVNRSTLDVRFVWAVALMPVMRGRCELVGQRKF